MTALKIGGIAIGGVTLVLFWIISVALSFAVPALALWALLHFGFGVNF